LAFAQEIGLLRGITAAIAIIKAMAWFLPLAFSSVLQHDNEERRLSKMIAFQNMEAIY
jgi:hypothetical protein